ncbi:MAG: TrmH family RNA methyltransferase [Opitutales bacterium]
MTEPLIQSRQNEQVKDLVRLRERKHRERQGRFLVEGLRELEHALKAGFEVDALFFCPELFPSRDHAGLIERCRRSGAPALTRMSRSAFSKAAYRENPDGLLATAAARNLPLDAIELPRSPLLLVLEGIEKPGNLGAILRSADGAGVDAVLLVDCVLDRFNPNAIRASRGLVFTLPVVTTERPVLTDWLKRNAIRSIATTPEADAAHWETDLSGGVALFLGSESKGLTDYWIQNAAQQIRIPMAGQADSLNVAATAAVCLYEARRQRTD